MVVELKSVDMIWTVQLYSISAHIVNAVNFGLVCAGLSARALFPLLLCGKDMCSLVLGMPVGLMWGYP